jgi:hypothetical protein
MNEPIDTETQETAPAAGLAPNARILLRVVYTMGIILVLLFLLLIGAIIFKSSRKADPSVAVPPAALNLGLQQGSDIRSAAIDGDRLVVNTGREVIVVDIKKNLIISRVTAGP